MHSATILALTASLFSLNNAHIMLSQPVPYDKGSITTSPLANAKPGSSGSDYPCQKHTYQITKMNQMKVGDEQPLAFEGKASHGGGTCQLAVSLDEKPTASSVFKLIHVFEGGCPTTGAGNDGTNNYTFSIPEGFPNGKATLAWSWYNRVGNREFYMNCAPIEVSGGSNSKDFYNSLPNQYLINLPTSDCSSVEGSDLQIPSPGKFVTKGGSYKLAGPQGPECAAAASAQGGSPSSGTPSSGGGDTTSPSPAPSSGSGSSDNSQGTQPATPPSSTPSSGYGDSSGNSSPGPIVSAVPTSGKSPNYSNGTSSNSNGGSSDNAPAPAPSAPAPAPTTSPSDSSGASEGVMQCNGESQFGLVNPNDKIVWQSVAAGTKCVNGAIVATKKRDVVPRRHARDMKGIV